ncbi:MAG: hypothetical protein IJG84_20405, partial [Kiritimatiellae bacterium]|nr:hypothetical protein [Kiritimatiellia bacterium]
CGVMDPTAKVVRSKIGVSAKVYRNAAVVDSCLGERVIIGDDTTCARCIIGNNVAINRRSYINDSSIGCYSYCGINTTINFSKVGKYCSFARNVDVGGFDHDYRKVTTLPRFRFEQLKSGEIPKPDDHRDRCIVGNDVWIAAGAQVLHKARVGHGAIVGGGAVVTKDVPPYAIVCGVPAKIIGFRFEKSIIDALLEIKWWDWPQEVVERELEMLVDEDVDESVIARLRRVGMRVNTLF